MPLNDTSVQLNVRGTLSKSLDLKTVTSALNFAKSVAYLNGTGAGQADKIWDDVRTIAASSTDDIDLSGALLDAFGESVAFARIKAIIVVAASANTNNVVVGGAAAAQFVGPFGASTHTVHVRPGGMLVLACSDATAWPVVNGSSDTLRVANGGGGTPVTYSIVVVGASA